MRPAILAVLITLLLDANGVSLPAADTSQHSNSESPTEKIADPVHDSRESFGDCGACDCDQVIPSETRRKWQVSADAMFLWLDTGAQNNTALVLDQDTGATLLAIHDVDYGLASAPRLTFGTYLDECRSVEASFFGIHHWDGAAVTIGDNNLRIPGDLALASLDFFDADQMNVSNSAELYSVELSYVQRLNHRGLSVLSGFRYLSFDESININSTDLDSGTSDYHVDASNDLYGAQLGARWRADARILGWEITGKAGLFGTDAQQSNLVGDANNSLVLRDARSGTSHAAFVGVIGATALVKLTHWLYLRGGYNLLWIEGISRAGNQLDFTDTADSGQAVNFGDGAFLHGANAGIEARW